MSQSKGDEVSMCPLLGFEEEQYIPSHNRGTVGETWSTFFTCIANGKRVYVWAYKQRPDGSCCVMVSDHVSDPARHANIAEIQNMYANQHMRQKERNITRTHRAPSDPFLLQSFIHHVTLGGNETMELMT